MPFTPAHCSSSGPLTSAQIPQELPGEEFPRVNVVCTNNELPNLTVVCSRDAANKGLLALSAAVLVA
eukprot:919379-Ditylum_brightwellii.AAC.1